MKKLQIFIAERDIAELYIILQLWCNTRRETFDYIRKGIEENFPEIAERSKIPVKDTSLAQFSDQMAGALKAAIKFESEYVWRKCRTKEDKVYMQAELDYITASKENMWRWLSTRGRFNYRNHKNDAKGHILSVEAYIE